ncbi:MAG: tRNA dihydrouridine(20/20a) synthase DusA [Myxococcales bacterium]|nr:tRNA dihydrouridine(20/20a) synthase DusA [Myxococcales bacterium]
MTRRGQNPRLSIAPMMERTDRHFRFIFRQFSKRALLYTEMVNTGAILRGDPKRHLTFHPDEHPIALQLGGDDPVALTDAAVIAVRDFGYDEVNINVGCPSDRVQGGGFGACLMARPEVVREAVVRMREAVSVPITVKHRIGIDDQDRYEDMLHFVDVVSQSGCDRFSVHARKAWLTGLSPKENRTIPPLRYDDVHRLKQERPDLQIEINGGFTDLDTAHAQLGHVDAVMIGRHAYDRPADYAIADALYFGEPAGDHDPYALRRRAVEEIIAYADDRLREGERLHSIVRHTLNLYTGLRGTGVWKRALGTAVVRPGATPAILRDALDAVDDERSVREGTGIVSAAT